MRPVGFVLLISPNSKLMRKPVVESTVYFSSKPVLWQTCDLYGLFILSKTRKGHMRVGYCSGTQTWVGR